MVLDYRKRALASQNSDAVKNGALNANGTREGLEHEHHECSQKSVGVGSSPDDINEEVLSIRSLLKSNEDLDLLDRRVTCGLLKVSRILIAGVEKWELSSTAEKVVVEACNQTEILHALVTDPKVEPTCSH